MVFALRCPASNCGKYMLIEDAARGTRFNCLICKQPFDVPGTTPDEPLEVETIEDEPSLIPVDEKRPTRNIPVAKLLPPQS